MGNPAAIIGAITSGAGVGSTIAAGPASSSNDLQAGAAIIGAATGAISAINFLNSGIVPALTGASPLASAAGVGGLGAIGGAEFRGHYIELTLSTEFRGHYITEFRGHYIVLPSSGDTILN